MRFIVHFICVLGLLLSGCTNHEADDLRSKLRNPSTPSATVPGKLTRTVIAEYAETEKALNAKYVQDLQYILDNDFQEKVNAFEDGELGIMRGYKHMFKVLIENNESLTEYWSLKRNKYFTPITTKQKLHERFLDYEKDVLALRSQIVQNPMVGHSPKELHISLPKEDISLSKMTEHSYANLAIEFGIGTAVSLLVLLIVAIITFAVGCCGAIPSWIVTLISIVISVVLCIWNDGRMTQSLYEQHQEAQSIDIEQMLTPLNDNTDQFYATILH